MQNVEQSVNVGYHTQNKWSLLSAEMHSSAWRINVTSQPNHINSGCFNIENMFQQPGGHKQNNLCGWSELYSLNVSTTVLQYLMAAQQMGQYLRTKILPTVQMVACWIYDKLLLEMILNIYSGNQPLNSVCVFVMAVNFYLLTFLTRECDSNERVIAVSGGWNSLDRSFHVC